MDFDLTDEQRLLKDSVERLVADASPQPSVASGGPVRAGRG